MILIKKRKQWAKKYSNKWLEHVNDKNCATQISIKMIDAESVPEIHLYAFQYHLHAGIIR